MKSSIIDFIIDTTLINIWDTLIAIEGFDREALVSREDSLFLSNSYSVDLDNNYN